MFIGVWKVGNVCRLAFEHPTSFAAILGIPVEIGKKNNFENNYHLL